MKRWCRTRAATATALLSLAAGCSVPGFEARTAEELVPEPPERAPAVDPGAAREWCGAFGSEPLAALIRRAGSDSLTLQQSLARLRRAEAQAREAGATLWPQVTAEATAGYGKQPGIEAGGDLPFPTAEPEAEDRYTASLAASYELNLWNRQGNLREAARLSAEAARRDARSARISLSAQLAEAYFDWLTERQLADLLAEQLESAEDYLRLTKIRFGLGQAQGLDIVQQRQETAAIRAQAALARGQVAAAENRLAVLLGASPRQSLELAEAELPIPPPLPLGGIPANLLELRPDLDAARLRLAAANRQAAATLAERLPAVRLTAEVFDRDGDLGDLFSDIFWNLLGAVTFTVFDGGRLEARADVAAAEVDEALYRYAENYLEALREVADAMALERAQRAYLADLRAQAEAAQEALALARTYYLRGASDYLRVLTAQQALHSSQRELLQARQQLLGNRIQLCRALGAGGELTEPTDEGNG